MSEQPIDTDYLLDCEKRLVAAQLETERLHRDCNRWSDLVDKYGIREGRFQARIAELEECLFDGLTVTSEAEVNAWLKRTEALLEKGKK